MGKCARCGRLIRDRGSSAKYCLNCLDEIKAEREKPRRCAYCGKEIKDRASNAKYCSESCSRNAEAHRRMNHISARANALNYKRGHVYRAYGFKCAVCGWQATNELVVTDNKTWYSHGLDIHHITPVSEGGSDGYDNLICLCPNCHRMVHMGLISPYELKMHAVDVKKAEKREKNKGKKLVINDMTSWLEVPSERT